MQPSTDKTQQIEQPIGMMDLSELCALLIKHNDIHEGLYNLSVEFRIGVGAVGPDSNDVLPGAMMGVYKIGLSKADQSSPQTVDAAIINPKKKTRTKKPST